MDNTIYAVEWRRYYSEYGICYLTMHRPQAEAVMEKRAESHPDLDFEIVEYKLDEYIKIWE